MSMAFVAGPPAGSGASVRPKNGPIVLTHAEVLATQPPTGRLSQLIAENPDSPEARLFRYVLLGYSSTNGSLDVDAIAASLALDTNVQSVEENLPIRFHVSRLPTKVLPNDELVGT